MSKSKRSGKRTDLIFIDGQIAALEWLTKKVDDEGDWRKIAHQHIIFLEELKRLE